MDTSRRSAIASIRQAVIVFLVMLAGIGIGASEFQRAFCIEAKSERPC
jgi:hypothetical protein